MPVLPEKRFIVACARLKRLVFAIPQESGLSPAEICKLQSLDERRAGLRHDQGSGDAALVAPARQARMDKPKVLRKRLRSEPTFLNPQRVAMRASERGVCRRSRFT